MRLKFYSDLNCVCIRTFAEKAINFELSFRMEEKKEKLNFHPHENQLFFAKLIKDFLRMKHWLQ
jgi:hypothetical protein